MATATFLHEGNYVDYTPTEAVSAGDVVVQSTLVGIATADIAASALGALATQGVFSLPKLTATGSAIDAGDKVYWDETYEVVTETSEGNTYLGKLVEDAADADATAKVKLCQ